LRKGGRARSRGAATLPADTPDLALTCVPDVVAALGVTINQVRRGEVDAKLGNCIGLLCSTLRRALTGDEVERRIRALEEWRTREQQREQKA
jgi:hypothetical protein